MKGLKEKATKGIIWSAVEQLSVQGLQFVFGLLIARILSPSDYGLVGMLTIFIAIAQVFVDSGFSNSLIQKKDRTQVDFSTVFFFNVVISVIIYCIFFVSAPFIAQFYHQPVLANVARIVSLSLIINSLGTIQRTIFAIELNFKLTAIIALFASLASGTIGIILAYRGYGVWTLVAVTLIGNVVNNSMYWICSRWRPLFQFSWSSFRRLFSFGSKLLVAGLMRAIFNNLYLLVIGRKYGAIDVGYYNRSYSLALIFTEYIVLILERASFPVLCSIQDEKERLSEIFNKMVRMASFIILPIVVSLIVLAYPLIELVLTAKWLPAAPLLQILCIAYAMIPIINVNANILQVVGHSDYYLHSEMFRKGFAVIILLITLPFGLKWLCVGCVCSNIISSIISIHYAKKVVDTSFGVQINGLMLIVIASVIMGGSMWGVSLLFDSLWCKLIVSMLIGGTTYLFMIKIFKIQEMKYIMEMMPIVRFYSKSNIKM